jgi:hypothetical protein
MQNDPVGVTTIERHDQGHLYPLGERHDIMSQSTAGGHYLKGYLDSLFAGYYEPLLALRATSRPDLYKLLLISNDNINIICLLFD